MRFIHCADFHIDSPLSNLRTEEESGLTTESLLAEFGQMVSYAHAHDISSILISGDLFDSDHVSRTAALSIRQIILNNPDLIFYYLRGNHDKSCVFHVGTAPDNLLTFEESWTYYEPVPGITICGIETGGAKTDAASSLELGPDDFNLVMLHGNPDDFGNLAHRNIDYLAMGHIHKPSSRKIDTRCHMVYPGCPMGRGWDETGDKGVCIVNVGAETSVRAVSLQTVRFHDLTVEVDGGAEATLREVLPAASGNDFYRITLTGSAEINVQQLKKKFAGFPNLELRDRTEPPLEVWADADKDTLEGIYFGLLRKAMAENPEQAEEIQLAAEISRKLLSGREVRL